VLLEGVPTSCGLGPGIRSGSQQLTSGFGGANIGMASAELGGKGWKHHDKAY
jgi:hypothetical protein